MTLKNENKLPAETVPVLKQHVEILHRVLGERLVGVYVHGSAAMGGFNPAHSDLDYIALIESALTLEERKQLSEAFLNVVDSSGFKKEIEMSIVVARHVGRDFTYPTPFEFHFGGKEYVIASGEPSENPRFDPDLVSYFAVIFERGVAVFGDDIRNVFAPVPHSLYWQSVKHDIDDVRDGIAMDPVYHILNLCRTFYGLCNDKIYSKIEGAQMYLADPEGVMKNVVQMAYESYSRNTEPKFDGVTLVTFADMMLKNIDPLMENAISSVRN